MELPVYRSVPGHRCAISRSHTVLLMSLNCCSCSLVPRHPHKLIDGELYLMVLNHSYWSTGWKGSRPVRAWSRPESEQELLLLVRKWQVGREIPGNILKGIELWCFLPPTQLLTEVFTASWTCCFKQCTALLMLACWEKPLVIVCIACLSYSKSLFLHPN